MLRTVRIQEADFSIGAEIASLRATVGSALGAVSLFCGLVRDRHESDPVSGLFLEHYPGMTEQSIEHIVDLAAERWPLQAITVVHRVGQLCPGDQIVLVLTASAHRDTALAATSFVIDLLKTDAVFWKKETVGQAGHWVESRRGDFARAEAWRKDR
jgi:molybdopterin synthase catalytic subunit